MASAQDETPPYISADSSIQHTLLSKNINYFQGAHTIRGYSSDTLYYLPFRRIIPESEIFTIGYQKLTREKDYTIRYSDGVVRFSFVVDSSITVECRFLVSRLGIDDSYARRDLPIIRTNIISSKTDTIPRWTPPNPSSEFTNDLNGRGTITRGFTIGNNQDFTLNSGLNVQVTGQIGEDVTLEAVITDEQTPIQPEGNTERLQEIDKIYIEVRKADKFTATLGDFEIQTTGTQFGNFHRSLQGVRSLYNDGRTDAAAAYGTAKGKYHSNTLTITEGVQGPYELTGKNGERNPIIVAGSERVWLNGVALTRGENNDYVIDYNAGQITFTRKRLVTPESRIIVDFEYSNEVFRRNTASASVRSQFFDRRLTVGGAFLSESDDKNNPLNLSIDQQLRDSLASLDDRGLQGNGNTILVDGGRWVGEGRGAYYKVYDANSNDSIYVYSGSDSSGSYNVRFTDVGSGRGDYIRGNILGEFIYVGSGLGYYLPLVPMDLPTRLRTGIWYAAWNPVQNLRLRTEFALSQFDKNLYSPRQSQGYAYQLEAFVADQDIRLFKTKLGKFDLQIIRRNQDSNFTAPDRTQDAEYGRQWNIFNPATSVYSVTAPGLQETVNDFRLAYKPWKGVQTDFFKGELTRGDHQFVSTKSGSGLKIDRKNIFVSGSIHDIQITDRTQSVIVNNHTQRKFFDFNGAWRIWRPGLYYEDESQKNRQSDSVYGASYQVIRPNLNIITGQYLTLGASYEMRSDRIRNDAVDSLDGRVSKSINQRYYWQWTEWHNLNHTFEWQRRKREYFGSKKTIANPDRISNLVNASADYHPFSRAVQVTVDYQISQEQLQNRKIVFIPVPPNTGNFVQVRQDSFRQVPQGQGDWIQSAVRGQGFTPVVELKSGIRLRLEIGRLRSRSSKDSISDRWQSRFIERLIYEGLFRIEENQTDPDRRFYWLQAVQNKNTQRGNLLLRQELSGYDRIYDMLWRLRYETNRTRNRLLNDGQDKNQRDIYYLRIQKQVNSFWSWEQEGEVTIAQRQSLINVSSLNIRYDIHKNRYSPSIVFKPKPTMEYHLRTDWLLAKDYETGSRAKIMNWQPTMVFSWLNRGRWTNTLELTRLWLKDGLGNTPFEVTDGRVRGWNWLWISAVDYRAGEHVIMRANYTGRKYPGQKIIHLGTAEVQAFF
ncbi:MAG TPA: hypothetical protein PKI67_04395 [bacterium]|nr:hypothetical protein [bacterium]